MIKTWTKEEIMIIFNLYCKLSFKESTRDNNMIDEYAKLLKRSSDSLIIKMSDLGKIDPELKKYSNITGIYGEKLDRDVWSDFLNNPMQFVYNSAKLIARAAGRNLSDLDDMNKDLPKGCNPKDSIRHKIGFLFFRKVVLSSYNNTCCISGVKDPLLVEACHIAEWDDDENKIVDPRNGLCLNYLMHKAYDRKFVSVSPDYKIKISERMIMSAMREDFRTYLKSINDRHIFLPDRFRPSRDLLAMHYEEFLKTKR